MDAYDPRIPIIARELRERQIDTLSDHRQPDVILEDLVQRGEVSPIALALTGVTKVIQTGHMPAPAPVAV